MYLFLILFLLILLLLFIITNKYSQRVEKFSNIFDYINMLSETHIVKTENVWITDFMVG